MTEIAFVPLEEFQRIGATPINKYVKLELLADMCRLNTLVSVKRAGSCHLGSRFSSLDIVTFLYYSEMNTAKIGIQHPDRDIYFSSKGHDAPGLYSVLFSLGILPKDQWMRLRRRGGTCGHPDVSTPGIEANTGSLGMGISKAKGMAIGKSLGNTGGRVFVMTGDGELQEGQIFEGLQSAAHQKIGNLIVIVDHNKIQSDKPVTEITDLENLEEKLKAFGWHVARSDGHDFKQLEHVFSEFKKIQNQPKILIADTIKGKGVSFMEHPAALQAAGGTYPWHAGAPNDSSFSTAFEELLQKINQRFSHHGLTALALEQFPNESVRSQSCSEEYITKSFGRALLDIGRKVPELIVLDSDLASDCGIREFEQAYPHRFIENGIAEQDMVSTAGGLARQGFLPVVNTFAAFLASRANEQIYNNASEKTRIIYAAHYAGLIPAGPGLSHQSIRDIALLGTLPNVTILEPCNAGETQMILKYCVYQAKENCVIRLLIGPSPKIIALPPRYELREGRGIPLTEGDDAILFAYGPVMLNEALRASEVLSGNGFQLKVVNMPWLNRIDRQWLQDIAGPCPAVYVLDDHSIVGGLGDFMLNALHQGGLLRGRMFAKFGIGGFPVWGTPDEVLHHHGLDGDSIASEILKKRWPNSEEPYPAGSSVKNA